MSKQLNLFNQTQPSDLEALDNTVNYDDITSHGVSDIRMPFREDTQPPKQIDWDIQQAYDSGDTQRVHELITIKHDMN